MMTRFVKRLEQLIGSLEQRQTRICRLRRERRIVGHELSLAMLAFDHAAEILNTDL